MKQLKLAFFVFFLIAAIFYGVRSKSVIIYIDENTTPEIRKTLLENYNDRWVTSEEYRPNYSLKVVKRQSDTFKYNKIIHFIQIGTVEVIVVENGVATRTYKFKDGQWKELEMPNIKLYINAPY